MYVPSLETNPSFCRSGQRLSQKTVCHVWKQIQICVLLVNVFPTHFMPPLETTPMFCLNPFKSVMSHFLTLVSPKIKV